MIPPGWESIPELLKRFTNTGSVLKLQILNSVLHWLVVCPPYSANPRLRIGLYSTLTLPWAICQDYAQGGPRAHYATADIWKGGGGPGTILQKGKEVRGHSGGEI